MCRRLTASRYVAYTHPFGSIDTAKAYHVGGKALVNSIYEASRSINIDVADCG
jgi:hypothetical protein